MDFDDNIMILHDFSDFQFDGTIPWHWRSEIHQSSNLYKEQREHVFLSATSTKLIIWNIKYTLFMAVFFFRLKPQDEHWVNINDSDIVNLALREVSSVLLNIYANLAT